MEIQPLAVNAFAVVLRSGVRLLYSYGSPAAVYVPGRGYLRTAWYISRTTSAHVSEFARGNTAREIPHDEILKIAEEA